MLELDSSDFQGPQEKKRISEGKKSLRGEVGVKSRDTVQDQAAKRKTARVPGYFVNPGASSTTSQFQQPWT